MSDGLGGWSTALNIWVERVLVKVGAAGSSPPPFVVACSCCPRRCVIVFSVLAGSPPWLGLSCGCLQLLLLVVCWFCLWVCNDVWYYLLLGFFFLLFMFFPLCFLCATVHLVVALPPPLTYEQL